MKQSVIAGIVMFAIGCLLAGRPQDVFRVSEGWKSKEKSSPSAGYNAVCRTVGSLFIVVGIFLMTGIIS